VVRLEGRAYPREHRSKSDSEELVGVEREERAPLPSPPTPTCSLLLSSCPFIWEQLPFSLDLNSRLRRPYAVPRFCCRVFSVRKHGKKRREFMVDGDGVGGLSSELSHGDWSVGVASLAMQT